MTTQAIMIAEIEDDCDRSDTDAIRNKIAAAIRNYQKERFWFNESRSITFPLVVGQTDYSVSDIGAEFYKVDAVYVDEDGVNISEVRRHDYRWSETLEGSVTNNTPYSWAYINRTIRFYPPPDDTDTVRITGFLKIDPPVADSTTDNEWFTEAYDLISARAKAELYAHRWENPSMAALMRAAEADYLRMLRKATSDKVGTGDLIPTDF